MTMNNRPDYELLARIARGVLITSIALLVTPMLLIMGGCSTSAESIHAMASAQADIARIRTIEADCSGPCRISYTDPRDRLQIKLPTNGWDAVTSVASSVERVVTGAVLPAAAVAMVREVRRAGDGGDVTTSNTTTTRNESTTTNTASGAGSSTGGDGNHEQIGPNSQNQANTDTRSTDSHDATATPTIVQVDP